MAELLLDSKRNSDNNKNNSLISKRSLISKNSIKSNKNNIILNTIESIVSKNSNKTNSKKSVSINSNKLNNSVNSNKKSNKSVQSKSNNNEEKNSSLNSENFSSSSEKINNSNYNNNFINQESEIKSNEFNAFERENRILKKVERIENSDSENEATDEEINIRFMISQDNKILEYWSFVITTFCLLSCFITPFEIAFNKLNSYTTFELFSVFVFTADIVINFFFNTKKNVQFIDNLKEYLLSWFFFDFLAVFPFNLFFKQNNNINEMNPNKIGNKFLYITFLFRLFRAFKLIQRGRNVNICLLNLQNKLKISINLRSCLLLLFFFAYLNHLFSCIFYYLARVNNFEPSTWVYELELLNRSKIELYYLSLYFILTTITTVGYGNIYPFSSLEKIYAVIIMMFGVIMYSFFISTFTVIIRSINQKKDELKRKLEYIDHIKRNYDIDKNTYDKVKRTLKFDTNREQIEVKKLLQELPNKLKLELSQVINDKAIKNFIFFRDQSEEFYSFIAPKIKPFIFFQNDSIHQPSDVIQDMYLINKGTVTYNMPEEYNEQEVRVLKRNWNFGEIEMCSGQPINYYIKIKSKEAEIYTLKKLDFVHLTINFKEAIINFLIKSILLYKEFKEKYYRVIKEKEEFIYYISHATEKNGKYKNDIESDLEDNEDESITENDKSSDDKLNNINSNNDASDEKSKSGDEELKNKSRRSKKKNNNNKIKKIGLPKKKLSAGKIQIISALKKEDLKVKKEIDDLIKLMKDSGLEFPETKEDNLYNLLKESKKIINKEERFNKVAQIESKLKIFLNNFNNRDNNNNINDNN